MLLADAKAAIDDVRRELRGQGAGAAKLAAIEARLSSLEGSILSSGKRHAMRRCTAAPLQAGSGASRAAAGDGPCAAHTLCMHAVQQPPNGMHSALQLRMQYGAEV